MSDQERKMSPPDSDSEHSINEDTDQDNAVALDELLAGYGSPLDSNDSEDSIKEEDQPPAPQQTAEPSYGARDVRLKDPNLKMMVSRSCGSPVSVTDIPLPPTPPPAPVEPRGHHSASGTPMPVTIVWHPGMSCPVIRCHNHRGHQFQNLKNFLRHFEEVHKELCRFYECPVEAGHFRSKRRGDMIRHLRSAHPKLSEEDLQGRMRNCPCSLRPNPAYVDPGNLRAPQRPARVPPRTSAPLPTPPIRQLVTMPPPPPPPPPPEARASLQTRRRERAESAISVDPHGDSHLRATRDGAGALYRPESAQMDPTMEVDDPTRVDPTRMPSSNSDAESRAGEGQANVPVLPVLPGIRPGQRGMFADVTLPMSWIPRHPDDIPAFLTWLAYFTQELEAVKIEARRRLIQEGGAESLRRAYEEELTRRRSADAEIARLRREVQKYQKTKEDGKKEK